MAKAKRTTTQKSLHRFFEEAQKLPIRRRVPYFEQLLKSGTIDEPEYAFLASWSIDEILSDSKRSDKDYLKLYLEFGSRRLFNLRNRKNWSEILGEGRSRFQAEKKGKDKGTKATSDEELSRCRAEGLALTVAAVLANPACPDTLHTAITDALSEIETHADTLSVDFLFGLFLSKPRVEEAKGGAA